MNDPIATAARFLLGNLEWIRHHPDAATHLADIEACAGVIRGVASGPRERRFLGPCGATQCRLCGPVENGHVCEGDIPVWACDGAVYGGIGGKWATCRDCGARYDQAGRIAERAELAHRHWYTAAEIADAYGIPASTIRSWRHRELLAPRAEHDGHPLYAVADVLALIATSKQRAGQWRQEAAEMGA